MGWVIAVLAKNALILFALLVRTPTLINALAAKTSAIFWSRAEFANPENVESDFFWII